MKLVIDTSVIIAVVSNETLKSKLVHAAAGAELIAPASLHWEIGNALSAMFKRGRITLEKAKEILRVYEQIPIHFAEISLDFAAEISFTLKIYAYDAYFIACAFGQNASILSIDKKLCASARKFGIKVIEVKI